MLEEKRTSDEYPTPVLAAVAHFEVAEVHPFADYNGRAARLFATAVFYRERFLERAWFSPERYYAEDKDAYYAALRAVKRTHNLEAWLEYYVLGLALEFERIAAKVRDLAAVTRALALPLELTTTQEEVIALLTVAQRRAVTVGDVANEVGVSTRTASRDLNALVDVGVLRAFGTTRDRRFVLAASGLRGGRPRLWSDERIEQQLRELVERVGRFPTYRDFDAAGHLSLYAAVQRRGGLEKWEERLQNA